MLSSIKQTLVYVCPSNFLASQSLLFDKKKRRRVQIMNTNADEAQKEGPEIIKARKCSVDKVCGLK